MDIPSRRTVEGMITATNERITNIHQLKDGDIMMMGYVQWPDFLPYRVVEVEDELYLTNVSAVKKHRFGRLAVQLHENSLVNIILYRAEIDTSNKTHPGFLTLAGLVLIFSMVSIKFMPTNLALIPLIVSLITTYLCVKAAKLPVY